MISKKVILTGSFGVGKTSLFNKFVYSKFSDKYLTTIGVKVNKKVIKVGGEEMSILLWDIAGEVSQDKVPVSYFLGASGIIYVFDLTRAVTTKNMKEDIEYLRRLLPNGVIKIVGNKSDLVGQDIIEKVIAELALPCDLVTSAKTGENVEELFTIIGEELLVA